MHRSIGSVGEEYSQKLTVSQVTPIFIAIVLDLAAGGSGVTGESLLIPARAVSAEVNVRQSVRREAVAVAEAVSSLELERSIFDSSETEILSAAFTKAWAYVEFDPTLGMLDVCERQSELARCLMAILKLGDSNPTSIANSAIALMRRNHARILRPRIARGLANDCRMSATP
jgi:hypothetical protein